MKIYMNDLLKDGLRDDPCITIDDGKSAIYVREAYLVDKKGDITGIVRTGRMKGSAGHNIKAWIELI